MIRRRQPADWAIVGLAVFLWIGVSARIVAAIDRYSPFLSWQTAVVFGGAIVVGVIAAKVVRRG